MVVIKRQEITSVAKAVEKIEPLCTVGGKINWYSHCGKQYGYSWKILNTMPHDPAIPLQDIYPKKMKSVIRREIYTFMFTAA